MLNNWVQSVSACMVVGSIWHERCVCPNNVAPIFRSFCLSGRCHGRQDGWLARWVMSLHPPSFLSWILRCGRLPSTRSSSCAPPTHCHARRAVEPARGECHNSGDDQRAWRQRRVQLFAAIDAQRRCRRGSGSGGSSGSDGDEEVHSSDRAGSGMVAASAATVGQEWGLTSTARHGIVAALCDARAGLHALAPELGAALVAGGGGLQRAAIDTGRWRRASGEVRGCD